MMKKDERGDKTVPVNITSDSGALHSKQEAILPPSFDSDTQSCVPVRGMGLCLCIICVCPVIWRRDASRLVFIHNLAGGGLLPDDIKLNSKSVSTIKGNHNLKNRFDFDNVVIYFYSTGIMKNKHYSFV